jgi:predicted metal-dependent hydrolase
MGTERMKFDWTQGALAEGLRLYDAGEFFAAHEAWESVWLRAQEPEKTFLQGLIQVTAAFHHLQRNNPQGTALLLQAALGRLEHYPARFGDISVTVLCDDIRAWLQALEADAPASQLGPESRKRPAIGPPLHSSLAESIMDGCTND